VNWDNVAAALGSLRELSMWKLRITLSRSVVKVSLCFVTPFHVADIHSLLFRQQSQSRLEKLCQWSGGPEFDSLRCHILWEAVGLEQGPLSLVSTIEELLERQSRGSGLENWDYGRRGSTALTTRLPSTLKKLALTSTASGGRLFGIVRSRTQPTEFVVVVVVVVVVCQRS
jgi:hypothetical protein